MTQIPRSGPHPPGRDGTYADIGGRLAAVRRRITAAEREYGRAAGAVALLAVSKGHPPAAVSAAAAAGQQSFGESYVQEAVPKIQALAHQALEWHFIGRLQSNKAKLIGRHFAWVHSLDNLQVAQVLSRHRLAQAPPLSVCIQVNVSGEPQKSGVAPDGVTALAEAVAALPGLALRGLMAIPAPSDDFSEQRRSYALVHERWRQCRDAGLSLDTLSMGMSHDLEAAICEGATMVRIGTAVFGPRLPPGGAR